MHETYDIILNTYLILIYIFIDNNDNIRPVRGESSVQYIQHTTILANIIMECVYRHCTLYILR